MILDALTLPPGANSPYSSPRSHPRSISRTRRQGGPTSSPPFPPHLHGPDEIENGYHNGVGNGYDMNYSYGSPPHYPPQPRQRQQHQSTSDPEDYDLDSDTELAIVTNSYPYSPPTHNHSLRSDPLTGSSTTTLAQSSIDSIRSRLLPLRHIESLLIAKLVPPNEDEATHLAGPSYSDGQSSPTDSHFNATHFPARVHLPPKNQSYRNQEIFIRPGPGWKGGLARARVSYETYDTTMRQTANGHRPMSAGNTGLETPDEPQEVLHTCRKDMIALWNDESVRDVLRRRKIRVEEKSGLCGHFSAPMVYH
jgi:hypothetical protein